MITTVRELMTRSACQRLKVARLSPMRVPPPIPCAISDSRSTARVDVAVAQRRRDMREAGVEDEGFRLAESVDDAVQEAHEERGVEAHRAGGVEEHDEAERLPLAPPPEKIDGRSAVRHAAMDGAADVETSAAPAHLLAADEPGAHARASRAASACVRAISSGSTTWRMSADCKRLGAARRLRGRAVPRRRHRPRRGSQAEPDGPGMRSGLRRERPPRLLLARIACRRAL